MKKTSLILLATFMTFASANAQLAGGFDGPRAPSMAPITIQEALSRRDDAIVVLTGKIVNSLGDEKYLFRDDTDEVIIEIDDEDWHGIRVTPEDTLEIVGKVDKDFMEQTKIDVKSFTVK